MARVRLAHADVTTLAAQIARLVNEDHEDTVEIPAPRSSQQTKGLPKGWAYVEDDEEGKREELCDPSRYGHLPPQLIHVQQQLATRYQSNPPKDSSTT